MRAASLMSRPETEGCVARLIPRSIGHDRLRHVEDVSHGSVVAQGDFVGFGDVVGLHGPQSLA
jgi:hypothetical protein